MKQLEILDLAMQGVLRLMESKPPHEHGELNQKLKKLAKMYVLEQEKTKKQ